MTADFGDYARAAMHRMEIALKDLRLMYNRYRGMRCFVLGNGPSLNSVDFELLDGEVVFGVNSIFLMTEKNGFRPTFYVVEDNLVFTENQAQVDAYDQVIKIMPVEYASQLVSGPDCFVFNMDQGFYKASSALYGLPRFNYSAEPVFYCGQSVTYINMQIAYYLGFAEVVLLGMDFSYTLPKDHAQQGNHIHSDGDDPNHFHKDYFGKGKTWKDPRLGRVLRSYHRAKFAFESEGRRIINATEGGKLELFDRVPLDSLLVGGNG